MWEVRILKAAARDIRKLPREQQAIAVEAISSLSNNPRSEKTKKLQGEAAAHNIYRLRTGDLRIVYQIKYKQLIILVIAVADRKEIYRLLKKRL